MRTLVVYDVERLAPVGEAFCFPEQILVLRVDESALRAGGVVLAAHGGKGGDGAHRPDGVPAVRRAVRLSAVFDDREAVCTRHLHDRSHKPYRLARLRCARQ